MEKLVNGGLTKDRIFVHRHQEISHYPLQEFLKVWYVHSIQHYFSMTFVISFKRVLTNSHL
jgi:hypothetical protein